MRVVAIRHLHDSIVDVTFSTHLLYLFLSSIDIAVLEVEVDGVVEEVSILRYDRNLVSE